ncbi:MAG: transglutaminase domain-containing protein [Candidatus Micrarchaeota archaeon]|nr:transglutaminase domain-containing protein [Candidatus Micrarchaeota archaeon]
MKKIFNKILFIFSIIFLQFVFSSIENFDLNPALVTSASYLIKYNYTLRSSSGDLYDAILNISIPRNSKIVSSSHPYIIEKDSFENNFLILNSSANAKEHNFYVELITSTSSSEVYELNYSNFYLSSDYEKNTSEVLKELALNITSNYSTHFQKVAALAIYVNQLIEYDESFVNKNISATELLKIKKGVCWHYSLLFSSLLNALGYKTRYVHGFAYSSSLQGWLGHVWVEVYLGEWIGVDPTWLEVGFIDGTHIPFFRSQSLDFKLASAFAYTALNSTLSLTSPYSFSQSLSKAENIVPLSLNISKKNPIKNAIFSVDVLEPEGKIVVVANLSNSSIYNIGLIAIHSCTDQFNQTLFDFSEKEKFFILEPNKEFYFFSVGKINQPELYKVNNDNSYYIINCPIVLEDKIFGQTIIKDVTINPIASKQKNIDIQLLKTVLDITEKQSVFLNSKLNNEIVLVGDNIFLSTNSSPFIFNFYPTYLGKNQIVVFSKQLSSADYNYNYSAIEPVILNFYVQKIENLISNLEAPTRVLQFTQFNVTVRIKENIELKNFTFSVQFGSYYKQFLINNYSFSFSAESDQEGKIPLVFYIKDNQDRLLFSNFVIIDVISKPILNIKNLSCKKQNNLYSIQLEFNSKGNMSSALVYFDQEKYVLGPSQSKLEVTLIQEPSNLKLIWYDVFNNSYTLVYNINCFKEENVLSDLKINFKTASLFSIFNNIYFLILLFILAIVLFIKLYSYYKNKKESS